MFIRFSIARHGSAKSHRSAGVGDGGRIYLGEERGPDGLNLLNLGGVQNGLNLVGL